jgi:hypothetical protein
MREILHGVPPLTCFAWNPNGNLARAQAVFLSTRDANLHWRAAVLEDSHAKKRAEMG